jgi:hypothetical protein
MTTQAKCAITEGSFPVGLLISVLLAGSFISVWVTVPSLVKDAEKAD